MKSIFLCKTRNKHIRWEDTVELKNQWPPHNEVKPTRLTARQNTGLHFLVGVTWKENRPSKNKTTSLNQEQPLSVLIATRSNIIDQWTKLPQGEQCNPVWDPILMRGFATSVLDHYIIMAQPLLRVHKRPRNARPILQACLSPFTQRLKSSPSLFSLVYGSTSCPHLPYHIPIIHCTNPNHCSLLNSSEMECPNLRANPKRSKHGRTLWATTTRSRQSKTIY